MWWCALAILERFQTLVTGVIAIGLAWYVSRPVYAQLAEMRLQSAAVRRELLVTSLVEIENRRSITKQAFAPILSEIGRELFSLGDALPTVDPEWASNEANAIAHEMMKLVPRENDPTALATALTKAGESMRRLYDCLDALHRSYSLDGDPDVSEQQQVEMKADEIAMIPELNPRLQNFKIDMLNLDTAFSDHADSVRKALAKLDKQLMPIK